MQQASLLYYSAKPQSGGILGSALVCPTSLYVKTIRFPTFCRSLPSVGAYSQYRAWSGCRRCSSICSDYLGCVYTYPDIRISGYPDVRDPDIFGAFTCRIETFSAFTRVQTSGCIIRGILAMCRRNTQMLFFWSSCMPSNSLLFLPFFLLICWLDDKVKVLFGMFSYRL